MFLFLLIYLFKFIFLFTPFTTSIKFSLEAKQELERGAPPQRLTPPPHTHTPPPRRARSSRPAAEKPSGSTGQGIRPCGSVGLRLKGGVIFATLTGQLASKLENVPSPVFPDGTLARRPPAPAGRRPPGARRLENNLKFTTSRGALGGDSWRCQ